MTARTNCAKEECSLPLGRLNLGQEDRGQLAFGEALDCAYEIVTEHGFALAWF